MEECLGFESSWMWNMSEAFSRDNEALAKALQVSLSDDSSGSTLLPAFTPQSSGPSTRNPLSASSSSKITKRKSRASKKSPTTYITADPSNFRRMVQQVTGVRFGEPGQIVGDVPVESVIRPQEQRGGVMQSTCLPTLDTSAAFFLDRARMRSSSAVGPVVGEGARIGSGFEFDGFASFPTLESWSAM